MEMGGKFFKNQSPPPPPQTINTPPYYKLLVVRQAPLLDQIVPQVLGGMNI